MLGLGQIFLNLLCFLQERRHVTAHMELKLSGVGQMADDRREGTRKKSNFSEWNEKSGRGNKLQETC